MLRKQVDRQVREIVEQYLAFQDEPVAKLPLVVSNTLTEPQASEVEKGVEVPVLALKLRYHHVRFDQAVLSLVDKERDGL